MTRTHPPDRFCGRILALTIAALLLPSCAPQSSARRVADADPCQGLKRVIDQADVGFRDIKGTVQISNEVTKWRASPIFPDSECDVFQWGGGRMTFGCVWSDSGQDSARATYQQNVARVQACLGPGWKQTDQPGQTGEASLFTRPGDATHVVLRYFRPRSVLGRSWETSLIVGDNVTADGR